MRDGGYGCGRHVEEGGGGDGETEFFAELGGGFPAEVARGIEHAGGELGEGEGGGGEAGLEGEEGVELWGVGGGLGSCGGGGGVVVVVVGLDYDLWRVSWLI